MVMGTDAALSLIQPSRSETLVVGDNALLLCFVAVSVALEYHTMPLRMRLVALQEMS